MKLATNIVFIVLLAGCSTQTDEKPITTSNAANKETAKEATKEVPKKAESKLDILTEQLRSKDSKKQIEAANSLKSLGVSANSATEALCEMSLSANHDVRQASLEAIESIRPDLHPHITTMVVDPKGFIVAAVEGISRLGDRGKPATPVLLAAFRASYDDKKALLVPSGGNFRATMYALAKVGSAENDFVKAVSDVAMSDNARLNDAMRRDCVAIIAIIGTKHPELSKQMLDTLTAIANKANDSDLCWTVEAIGKMGARATDAIPLVKKLKIHKNANVRRFATQALIEIETSK